jgi:hypothetical protein
LRALRAAGVIFRVLVFSFIARMSFPLEPPVAASRELLYRHDSEVSTAKSQL